MYSLRQDEVDVSNLRIHNAVHAGDGVFYAISLPCSVIRIGPGSEPPEVFSLYANGSVRSKAPLSFLAADSISLAVALDKSPHFFASTLPTLQIYSVHSVVSALHVESSLIVAGHEDGSVSVECKCGTNAKHKGRVGALTGGRSKNTFLSAGESDGYVFLWRVESSGEVVCLSENIVGMNVRCMKYVPEERIVFGGKDGCGVVDLNSWDIIEWKHGELVVVDGGKSYWLAVFSDGRIVLVINEDMKEWSCGERRIVACGVVDNKQVVLLEDSCDMFVTSLESSEEYLEGNEIVHQVDDVSDKVEEEDNFVESERENNVSVKEEEVKDEDNRVPHEVEVDISLRENLEEIPEMIEPTEVEPEEESIREECPLPHPPPTPPSQKGKSREKRERATSKRKTTKNPPLFLGGGGNYGNVSAIRYALTENTVVGKSPWGKPTDRRMRKMENEVHELDEYIERAEMLEDDVSDSSEVCDIGGDDMTYEDLVPVDFDEKKLHKERRVIGKQIDKSWKEEVSESFRPSVDSLYNPDDFSSLPFRKQEWKDDDMESGIERDDEARKRRQDTLMKTYIRDILYSNSNLKNI